MAIRRSSRVTGLVQSDIRRMTRECVRLGGLNLGQGICDLPTPPEVVRGAQEAIEEGHSTYSRFEGIDPLRAALAEKFAVFNKIHVDPEREIVVTIGSTGAFAATVQALFDPGDEVILFEPYYGYHVNTLLVGQCVPRFVTMTPPDWTVDLAAVEAAIGPRTRAILVNTPSNPCGKVWSRAELEAIADICQRHDLIAITDEIYEYIVYDGAEHVSLASLPGMRERTVTMGGYSKTFSITGWRIGYVAAPPALAEPIGLVNDLFYVCAATPLQFGVAAGIAKLPASYYSAMCAEYQDKRDRFCAALVQGGLTPYVPQGAYYVLADIRSLGKATARDAAMHILETVGVASVPGSAFYRGELGESLTRFCFAKRDSILDQACERIASLGRS